MASSRSSNIYDPIRNLWVAALPEEVVRQKLLQKMLQLGYPKGLIAVEKELKELPHIASRGPLPDRRIDILCFAKNLYPLLLIECKEKSIHERAFEQVFGYNEYVKAPFCAIAGGEEIRVSYMLNKKMQYLTFLPHYEELINALR